MVLGFKKRFEPKIVDGSKIHTIRDDVRDRWDTGNKIHFATGVRTSNYNCFKEGMVTAIQYVYMTFIAGRFEMSIGDDHYCDQYLSQVQMEAFAKNDGFQSLGDLQDWFIPLIKKCENGYLGKIIHWTDFRYGTK